VDVLIHDSQYTAAELPERRDFGHSTVEYAVGLALEAGVRRLLLFHHDPTRTDDAIDAILAGLCAGSGELRVEAATQGSVIDLS
jgi:ribonuclease BN (tRNA processing enzyme)